MHAALIDDDDDVRASLAMVLRQAGYRVAAFADAAHFIEAVAGLPPGVIVTDIRMPGLSGIELIKRLTEMGEGIAKS